MQEAVLRLPQVTPGEFYVFLNKARSGLTSWLHTVENHKPHKNNQESHTGE